MTRVTLFSIALLFSLLTNAQVSEIRNVGGFSKIKVSHGIKLIYTQTPTQEVKVETDNAEKMQYIKTEIEGSTLRVYIDTDKAPKPEKKRKRKNYSYNNIDFDILTVYVSNALVNNFQVSSSASLFLKNGLSAKEVVIDCSSSGSFTGTLKCTSADIELSSSADLDANIVANAIHVKVSSSADATLSGTTEIVTIRSSSSGDCNAKDLISKSASVESSSSSSVVVSVTETLVAKASSSASIKYFGNPTVDRSESSSGSVTKR